MGMDCIGIELGRQYVKMAKERTNQARKKPSKTPHLPGQRKLFDV